MTICSQGSRGNVEDVLFLDPLDQVVRNRLEELAHIERELRGSVLALECPTVEER